LIKLYGFPDFLVIEDVRLFGIVQKLVFHDEQAMVVACLLELEVGSFDRRFQLYFEVPLQPLQAVVLLILPPVSESEKAGVYKHAEVALVTRIALHTHLRANGEGG